LKVGARENGDAISERASINFKLGFYTNYRTLDVSGNLGWTCTIVTGTNWSCHWEWLPYEATQVSPIDYSRSYYISRDLSFIEIENVGTGGNTGYDEIRAYLLLPPDNADAQRWGETEYRFNVWD